MTLLLIAEAVDSGELALDDMVTASERAASMGGSRSGWRSASSSPSRT